MMLLITAGARLRAAEAPVNPPHLFAAPAQVRPLNIAIYDGPGSGEKGIKSVTKRAEQLPGAKVTALEPEEIGTRDLSQFDIIIFSGGSGSAQAKAIGEAGRKNVRQFVEHGGGYLGICAGAYLACAGFDWGLGILNAKTVSNKWKRGGATLQMQLTDDGKEIFGDVARPFSIRYHNGPIIKPLGRADLPAYRVAALFRTEIADFGSPKGVMVNSPAAVYTTFGQGRVITISPHSEDTPGLENVVPRALAWLGEKETVATAK
ncbi:biofilm PGA synthesis protein PgaB [Horticoccus luteus]|uniref:Biofilm PGA synthesis protein PgaB n=2 Tax=Horticoccus luteus TaxID=2862869 RepID=A0A8F9TX35_9BACT|nr:biofilm PGA synthesis protein PgaB [Horticoccus luteus]